jgi:putative Mn2+ efflux pump MntP
VPERAPQLPADPIVRKACSVSPFTLTFIALGVSADAFAVAVGKGLGMRRFDLRAAATIAVAFGTFQAGMPLLGWLLGSQMERIITSFDHWIAFGLLAVAGGKMLWEGFGDTDAHPDATPGWHELLVLSTATSIDALAVGIGLAFLPISILPVVLLIGATTAVLSLGGVVLGHRAGARWRRPAVLAGGVILILIGLRILLDHLDLLTS